jgi:HlyD family secretion protein
MLPRGKNLTVALLLLAVVFGGIFFLWVRWRNSVPTAGLVSGNGRIEATEIDVATKLAGRVTDIRVNEGDFVAAGQPLADMQVDGLLAQRAEAQAQQVQAFNAVIGVQAQVAVAESNWSAAQAVIVQRESELDSVQRRLVCTERLGSSGAATEQDLDDARANVRVAQAALVAARAQAAAAHAAIAAVRAQVVGAQSGVTATEASIARIQVDIADCQLKSPRSGRIQYRIAQPGEVLGAGGKVLNLVDLSDVYMTFFLPETVAGRVALGSEVRLILDAAPERVIPARVFFVASTAQFTPKTVETASERQKMMFRVKAQIDRELLAKNLQQVKTGLPGVAWLKIDPAALWPAHLTLNLPP